MCENSGLLVFQAAGERGVGLGRVRVGEWHQQPHRKSPSVNGADLAANEADQNDAPAEGFLQLRFVPAEDLVDGNVVNGRSEAVIDIALFDRPTHAAQQLTDERGDGRGRAAECLLAESPSDTIRIAKLLVDAEILRP